MDIKTYMPFAILTKMDIASMMNSLEVRTPIIDKKIAEFAATIPHEFNINNSRGELSGKLLLKKLLEKKFPKEFIYRQKMGFAMPTHNWIGNDSKWSTEMNARLLSSDSKLAEYFNQDQIKGYMNKGLEGPIWLLLFLEEWLRQN
jgi:asparagine synthase (glutamine-hydrolysing)